MDRFDSLHRLRKDAVAIEFATNFLSAFIMALRHVERRYGAEHRHQYGNDLSYTPEFHDAVRAVCGGAYHWGSETPATRARIDGQSIACAAETVILLFEEENSLAGSGSYTRKLIVPSSLLLDVLDANFVPSLLDPLPVWKTYHIETSEALLTFVEERYGRVDAEVKNRKQTRSAAIVADRETSERAMLAALLAKYPDMIPKKPERKRLLGLGKKS